MSINRAEILERLERIPTFDVDRFVRGPKRPDDLEIEQIERETQVVITAKEAATYRDSVVWSFSFTPQRRLEEDGRFRRGIMTRGPDVHSGSGTVRKGHTTSKTLLRELLGDEKSHGEMPQLKELLDKKGIMLGREHLDFHSLRHENGIRVAPSTVYLGFTSHANRTHVVIDFAELGFSEPPWPNGTVAYDMGTFIPLSWHHYPEAPLHWAIRQEGDDVSMSTRQLYGLMEHT